jgi:hypothetical protein
MGADLVLRLDHSAAVFLLQQIFHVTTKAVVFHLSVATQEELEQGVMDEDVLILQTNPFNHVMRH